MHHLDEGLMMALLDGELSAAEQREVEGHLNSCAECSGRLVEARALMAEADGLVGELIVPPATFRATKSRKRSPWISGRNLAWAASVVAALGLGISGGIVFMDQAERSSEVAISPQPAEAPRDQGALPPSEVPSASGLVGQSPDRVGSGQTAGGLPANQARPSAERARGESDRAPEERAGETPSVATNAFDETSQAKLSIEERRIDSAPTAAASLADAAGRAAPAVEALRRQAQPQSGSLAELPLVPRDEVTTRQRLDSDFRSNAPVFRQIPMEEAVRHLGGVIRLVDGLTPEEFEVAAPDSAQPLVRVIYRVGSAETRLILEQRRTDNSFVASDLQRLNSTVKQTRAGNWLSWNDLDGFSLSLFGLVSPDSLFHFKSLVK
jgi:hypothetical protein